MKVAFATSTRADWGLLSPLARELRRRGLQPLILATGMHLDPALGMTVSEIEADGFVPSMRLPLAGTPADAAAEALRGFGEALGRLRPDTLVVLGDRSEMLAVATAAMITGVPVTHIAGGTVSEGAIDDNARHAITKLSTLHLVETEQCRGRVIAMGENPETVVTAGSLGVANILATPRMDRISLERNLGWEFGDCALLATLHPETRGAISPFEAMREFIEGLRISMAERPDLRVLMTYPNNDVDPAPQIGLMRDFERGSGGRVLCVPSLGRVRYMSALDIVAGVAGNSSGGIVEVASAGIPVLDVGGRQRGRERAASVFHCDTDRHSISSGIGHILSDEVRAMARTVTNPYARPDTVGIMADAIMGFPFRPFPSKRFHLYVPAVDNVCAIR